MMHCAICVCECCTSVNANEIRKSHLDYQPIWHAHYNSGGHLQLQKQKRICGQAMLKWETRHGLLSWGKKRHENRDGLLDTSSGIVGPLPICDLESCPLGPIANNMNQRNFYRNWFSSAVWVLETELRSLAFAQSTFFTQWDISQAWYIQTLKTYKKGGTQMNCVWRTWLNKNQKPCPHKYLWLDRAYRSKGRFAAHFKAQKGPTSTPQSQRTTNIEKAMCSVWLFTIMRK